MANKKASGIIFLKILLAAFGTAAQNIHIMPGGHLAENGRVYMMLNNIAFVNDGGFSAGNGSVIEFIGGGPSSTATIGGANLSPFYNLLVAKSAGNVVLSQDITVSGGLAMNSGNLELNGHIISLSGNGQITRETETSRLIGPNGGMVQATATLTANVASNPGNLGAELLIHGTAGSNVGTYLVQRRQNAVPLAGGLTSINRSYTITSGTNTPVTGNLRFFYLNAELNGADPNQLNCWTTNGVGGVYTELGKDTNDVTNKWVLKTSINEIGIFTLGPDLQGGLVLPGSNSVKTAPASSALNVYPNPAHDHFTVSLFCQEAKEVLFSLFDQSGHLMQQKVIYCAAGTNNLSWDMTNYTAGIYYLSFNNQGAKNIKIIKD